MNCSIPGRNVKVVAKAIQVLSKFGDDLYIEGYPNKLTFRTVNSSRSAYACFEFNKPFFTKFEFTADTSDPSDDGNYSINCKTQAKSCLGIFRSLAQIDKSVQSCKLQVDGDDLHLVFKLFCKHGIVKTHRLNFEESDSIQAVYDSKDFDNNVSVPSRLLSESMTHFHFNTDEITFHVSPENLTIENLVGDVATMSSRSFVGSGMLCTKIALSPGEFSDFSINSTAKLTFCLKELRAISSFCDYTNQALRVQYQEAGAPIIFAVRADSYSADFVLSTVNNEDDGDSIQGSQRNSQSSQMQPPSSLPVPGSASQPPLASSSGTILTLDNKKDEDETPHLDSIVVEDDNSETQSLGGDEGHQIDGDFVEASPPRQRKFRGLFKVDDADDDDDEDDPNQGSPSW